MIRSSILQVIVIWAASRLIIILSIQVLPGILGMEANIPNPPQPIGYEEGYTYEPGWHQFLKWDSYWYKSISEEGYQYQTDGKMYNIAFFPVYPYLIKFITSFNIPFSAAGTLINHVALLGAMLILFGWIKNLYDGPTAIWTVIVTAFFPYSLFCSLVYTEGLFLLFTILSLRAFDSKRYYLALIAGILATATRGPGIALVLAFLFTAYFKKLPLKAYITMFFVPIGLFSYSLFCYIQFGDPIAYSTVQIAWHPPESTTRVSGWGPEVVAQLLNLSVIEVIIDTMVTFLTLLILIIGLIRYWEKLPTVILSYSIISLAMVLLLGGLNSIVRYMYVIPALHLILGILFKQHKVLGVITISVFLVLLIYLSVRITGWYWVA